MYNKREREERAGRDIAWQWGERETVRESE